MRALARLTQLRTVPRPRPRAPFSSMSSSPPPAKRARPDPAVAGPEPTLPRASDAPVQAQFLAPADAAPPAASTSAPRPGRRQPKAPNQAGRADTPDGARRRKHRRPLPEPFSPADVLWRDVRDFLGPDYVDGVVAGGTGAEWEPPIDSLETVEVRVGAFTVSGESLSLYEKDGRRWALVVPFAHPGDLVRTKIFRHDRFVSYGDLVEVLEYNEASRGGEGDRRVNPAGGCKYFGECGGCQLQPVPYAQQLLHKRQTLILAYSRFSTLPASAVPAVLATIGSPKQWGYRTKITPHFGAPPKKARATGAQAGEGEEEGMNAVWEPKIGFERKGRPGVMDIEECPIAVPVLNTQLTQERARVKATIMSYKKGSTILLRSSLPAPDPVPTADAPFDPSTPVPADDAHVAVTDHRAAVYERVGDLLFTFTAGNFFQNNNSILTPLVDYVRAAVFPPASPYPAPTHLVDTYCGSGLFGLSLSPAFARVAGVEISPDSIEAARRNAEMNGLGDKTTWLCGKAEDIFGGLPEAGFAGAASCVVVDPPRKGCDTPFLEQLLAFRPITVVYVSCNVHTQARDVGWFIHESEKRGGWAAAGGAAAGAEAAPAGRRWRYVLESLRGFDLFPQTAHVEGVAVLRLVEVDA